MTSLNPVFTIGMQVMEVIQAHERVSKEDAHRRAVEILTEVGIPDAAQRMKQYPHHFSGGQRQRVMIAIALVLNPSPPHRREPTTALDVTIPGTDPRADARDEVTPAPARRSCSSRTTSPSSPRRAIASR